MGPRRVAQASDDGPKPEEEIRVWHEFRIGEVCETLSAGRVRRPGSAARFRSWFVPKHEDFRHEFCTRWPFGEMPASLVLYTARRPESNETMHVRIRPGAVFDRWERLSLRIGGTRTRRICGVSRKKWRVRRVKKMKRVKKKTLDQEQEGLAIQKPRKGQ